MSPSERAYRNLAAAARVEGGISPEERKLLNAYVLRLGLDAARARELEGDGGGFLVPEDAQERRETLRAVLELVAADGRIAPRELELARLLAGPRSSKELDLLLDAALRRDRRDLEGALLSPGGALEAPVTRICQSCDKPFAARDRYEQYCRICRRDIVDPRASSRRGEWMKGLLLLLLLLPSAFLVERVTGLWSSGYAALKANAPAAFMEDGRFQCGHAVYIMPAAALSVALAAGIAWAVGALFMLQVRRRG